MAEAVPVGEHADARLLWVPLHRPIGRRPLEALRRRGHRIADLDRLQRQVQGAAFNPRQAEHVGQQPVQSPGFRGDPLDAVPDGGVHLLGPQHVRGVGKDGADRGPQLVRDGGEQVAELLLGLLQELDLLLRARQAHGGLGRRRLVAVQANEFRICVAELPGEPLRSDLRLPPAAGQEADHARGAEEDGQVDEILLVSDG